MLILTTERIRALQERRDKMPHPTNKLLERTPPFIPSFLRQQEAVFLLVVKKIVEFGRGVWVDNHSVFLIIPRKTTRIEISRSDSTKFPVYHNYLAVMKPWFVHPDIATMLHQLVGIVEAAVGR